VAKFLECVLGKSVELSSGDREEDGDVCGGV